MTEAALPFALGTWYGLSVPITVHVAAVLLERSPKSPLSWAIRLIGAPVAIIGQFCIAAAFGLQKLFASWTVLGLLLGLAVYILCAWLNRRGRTTHGT